MDEGERLRLGCYRGVIGGEGAGALLKALLPPPPKLIFIPRLGKVERWSGG